MAIVTGAWSSVLSANRQDVSRTRQDSMAIDNSSMAVYMIVEMFCRTADIPGFNGPC